MKPKKKTLKSKGGSLRANEDYYTYSPSRRGGVRSKYFERKAG